MPPPPVYLLAGRYQHMKALGEGSYGVVDAAIDHERGDHVAVKRIRAVFDTYVMATRILREIKFNRLLRGHDNLVQLRDVLLPTNVCTFHDTYLVFDRMPCDLSRVIKSREPIGSDSIKFLMFQLLRGLLYFHRAGVLHRDIKPSNLLVDGDSRLKICDLGFARGAFNNGNEDDVYFWTSYVQTQAYRAPELLLSYTQKTKYTAAVDIWSAGCVFAELFLRKPLFPGRRSAGPPPSGDGPARAPPSGDGQTRELLEERARRQRETDARHMNAVQVCQIMQVTGKPPPDVVARLNNTTLTALTTAMRPPPPMDWAGCFPKATAEELELLQGMLEFDPQKRLTAAQALRHPYFAKWRAEVGDGRAPPALTRADFAFERRVAPVTPACMDALRAEMVAEITLFHPRSRDAALAAVAGGGGGGGPRGAWNAAPTGRDRGRRRADHTAPLPPSGRHAARQVSAEQAVAGSTVPNVAMDAMRL